MREDFVVWMMFPVVLLEKTVKNLFRCLGEINCLVAHKKYHKGNVSMFGVSHGWCIKCNRNFHHEPAMPP